MTEVTVEYSGSVATSVTVKDGRVTKVTRWNPAVAGSTVRNTDDVSLNALAAALRKA